MVLLLALAVAMAGCQTVQRVGNKLQGAVDKVLGSRATGSTLGSPGTARSSPSTRSWTRPCSSPWPGLMWAVVPSPVARAWATFIGNIQDAWSAVNLFLQGRFKAGAEQTMRVAINTGLGLAGVLDIASDAG